MLRSMYSGISGMRVNQTKLDVAGNNIANVGTTGFKGSRVRFQDMLSQNVSQALGPGRYTGGVNAVQVGLGVQVAGIDTIVTQGMMQPTGRNLDAAIDGTGYFVVARGQVPTSNAGAIDVDTKKHAMVGGNFETSFTRDGSFTLDHEGSLLTSDGYRVMGYALSEKSGTNANTLSIDYDKNGLVSFVDSESEGGLVNSGSLVPLRIPDSVYVNADNISTETEMNYTGSGDKSIFDTDQTQEGMEDYPKIKINGSFKGKEDIKVEIKYEDSDDDDTTDTKSWMVFINGKNTFIEAGTDIDASAIGGSSILTIEEQNQIKDLLNGTTITTTIPGDSNITNEEDKPKYSWEFTLRAERDKKIRSFSIEKDGVIKAVLDDGSVSALGQIAMASFKNPEGLKKAGRNMLENTANSGEPIIRSGIGTDIAYDNEDGYGDMAQGMLEMSNVDLAEQFTDMIVTQRAFQAAGKMISTGDEILQEIINLKR